MNQFCKDVIKFLQSEYSDAYSFNLIAHQEISGLKDIKLEIKIYPAYTKIISGKVMEYIYQLYSVCGYLDDRKQYRWQKELIDMIEGG
jgi:hypothetical protein